MLDCFGALCVIVLFSVFLSRILCCLSLHLANKLLKINRTVSSWHRPVLKSLLVCAPNSGLPVMTSGRVTSHNDVMIISVAWCGDVRHNRWCLHVTRGLYATSPLPVLCVERATSVSVCCRLEGRPTAVPFLTPTVEPTLSNWPFSGHIKTAEQQTIIQQYGLAGCGPAQVPRRCIKFSSSPINGQCTNFIFILFNVDYNSFALKRVNPFPCIRKKWRLTGNNLCSSCEIQTIFDDHFIANLPVSLAVKKFKSRSMFGKLMDKSVVSPFWTRNVEL